MSIITLYKLDEQKDLSSPRCPDCLYGVKQMCVCVLPSAVSLFGDEN